MEYEEQSQKFAHNFFDIKGIVQKEFVLAVKQSIPHTTVTFYGDCVKIRGDFVPNFGDERTGCCMTTTRRLTLSFSPENF
jgi:hypothetical protein